MIEFQRGVREYIKLDKALPAAIGGAEGKTDEEIRALETLIVHDDKALLKDHVEGRLGSAILDDFASFDTGKQKTQNPKSNP